MTTVNVKNARLEAALEVQDKMLALMSEAINPHQLEVTTQALTAVQVTIKQLRTAPKVPTLRSDIVGEIQRVLRNVQSGKSNVMKKNVVLASFHRLADSTDEFDKITDTFDELIKPLFDLQYIEMVATGEWSVVDADAAVALLFRMVR